MQVTFDGVSLTTTPFIANDLPHEGVSNREIFMAELARRRGGNILNTQYKPKTFRLTGTIYGSTRAELEQHIDEFKELMSRKDKNLDIEYAGGMRRYIATAKNIPVPRKSFHSTFAPFEVEFVVPSGVGTDIALTTSEVSGIVDLDRVNTLSVLGSAEPEVSISFSITDAVALTKLEVLANGDKITLDRSILAGDEIVIDTNTLKVTVNGEEVDYSGIFPRFFPGANLYKVEFTGTSVEYVETIEYLKTYI